MKVPLLLRQFLAEILGTFLLVIFSGASVAQALGGGPSALTSGLPLTIGILASGGVSGGHLNPAMTLAFCVVRKCKWIQFPVYVIAQFLGALIAAALLYGDYSKFIENINDLDKAKGIFATYPNNGTIIGEVPTAILVYDQILATALLLIIIMSVNDEKNVNVGPSLGALYCGLGLTAIKSGFALNAGCSMNPAADFIPRLFSLMIPDMETKQILGEGTDYFFWIPLAMPMIGGPIGAIVYHFMVGAFHPKRDIYHYDTDPQTEISNIINSVSMKRLNDSQL